MPGFGTEFKVGIFALLAAAATGYMFLVLNPDSFSNKSFVTYYTILPDAANIVPRTHVKTNGVTIGSVQTIDLDTQNTKVALSIDKSVRIPLGSTLEIRTTGLLGDAHVEIMRSSRADAFVQEGDYIPVAEGKLTMNEIVGLVGSIARDIKVMTSSFAAVFEDNGDETVAGIVGNIQNFTENLDALLAENRNDVRDIVTNLRGTTDALQSVLGDQEEALNEMIRNLAQTSRDMRSFSKVLDDLGQDENRERFQRILANLDKTMSDVSATTQDIKLVAQRVEQGKGTIGKLINDEQTLAEVEGAIKDLREVLAPATKLKIGVDVRSELSIEGNARTYFDLRFQTRKDRYYLLGITDKGRDIYQTTTELYDADPSNVEPEDPLNDVQRERKTVVRDEGLKFNMQFAKRWYFATLRLGLFESTGGLGADLHFWRDRVTWTIEAFDWEKRLTPSGGDRYLHLRSVLTMIFYDHIYAQVGVDIDDPDDPEPYLGLGLRFYDEDLKAAFGAAALAL